MKRFLISATAKQPIANTIKNSSNEPPPIGLIFLMYVESAQYKTTI